MLSDTLTTVGLVRIDVTNASAVGYFCYSQGRFNFHHRAFQNAFSIPELNAWFLAT